MAAESVAGAGGARSLGGKDWEGRVGIIAGEPPRIMRFAPRAAPLPDTNFQSE
jgi:hypothetical protein